MISIYNETKTPWALKVINDKAICLTKTRLYKRGDSEKTIKKTAHILSYNNIFDAPIDEINDVFENDCINMNELTILSEKNTTILFSKKDYNPFITERDKNLKDIFLISIDLKGQKVVKISNENIFILESFILGGELCLIASLNKLDSILQIKLWDSAKNTIVVYSFGCGADMPYVEITEEMPTGSESKTAILLRKFRPARATYTIVTQAGRDEEQLLQLVNKDYHNIVVVTKDNMDDAISNLVGNNYKAVTLFMNVSDVKSRAAKSYETLSNKLLDNFNLFYQMMFSGKVIKVKI